MRYLKFLILALLFVLSMLFFVENTAVLSNTMQVELNLVFAHLYSLPVPLYLVILIGFLAGAVFCLAYFLVDRVRLGRELKTLRKRATTLEDELLALRTKPIAAAAAAGPATEQNGQQPASQPAATVQDLEQPLSL